MRAKRKTVSITIETWRLLKTLSIKEKKSIPKMVHFLADKRIAEHEHHFKYGGDPVE